MDCKHENFTINANVIRLTDENNGVVTEYRAEFQVICEDCKTMFEFVGVPTGYFSQGKPTVNLEGTQLFVSIKPLDIKKFKAN
jgi:hypothetical protein